MGIQGLLPFLEKATKTCHISEFRSATVAIDTYCWLHKGANACALQLASGEGTQGLVNYCLKYIKLLQSFDIKPILVFDGKNLPAKADTESKRREARSKAKQRANELLKLGKVDEARTFLKQSINITPEMAADVIKECQKLQIDCIVAPYESDAQLAFFSLRGVAEIIITEDSDLMLFGCSKVLYKLDLRGCGYLVESEKIPLAMKMKPNAYKFDKFRHMCILSGCDYVESLQGIGLKKAEKFMKLTEETNPLLFLEKVPRYLNMRHLQVSDKYKESFMLADATFRHQTVFDPFKRELIPLTDPQVHGTHPKYCKNAGKMFDSETAYQLALGNLHPTSHQILNDWSPTKNKLAKNSIWSGVLQKSVSRKQQQQLQFIKKKEESQEEYKYDGIEEALQTEADKKIELELASYFRKPEKRKIESDNEDEIEEKTERYSPVLQKNPFLKKISKFQITKSNTDIVVKSRYFCSSSDIQKIEINTADDEESVEEIVEINKKATRYFCSSSDIQKIETKTEDDEKSLEELAETNKKAISSDTENIPDNSFDCPMEALSRIKLTDSTESVNKNESPIEIISGNITLSQPCSSKSVLESSSKRKRPATCRTVGLKRIKPDSQPTLHNFFANFQKK